MLFMQGFLLTLVVIACPFVSGLCTLFPEAQNGTNSKYPKFQCVRSDAMWQMSLSYCADIGPRGSKELVNGMSAEKYIQAINNWDCARSPLVSLKSDYIPDFTYYVLPYIKRSIFLFTLCSAYPIPGQFNYYSEFIRKNPLVLHWFTINYDGDSRFKNKISTLPIGLDLHSSKFITNESEYQNIRQKIIPPTNRSIDVWNDATPRYVVYFGASREKALEKFKENPLIHTQDRWVTQEEAFHDRSRHLFLAAPVGNGIDTLRLWEGLYFDHIVIVRSTSLNELYDGLPVVIVEDWSEITMENLKKWKKQFFPLLGSPEVRYKLTSHFWLNRIKQIMIDSDVKHPYGQLIPINNSPSSPKMFLKQFFTGGYVGQDDSWLSWLD